MGYSRLVKAWLFSSVIAFSWGLPICDQSTEENLQDEYTLCQAKAQDKLRNETLDICNYFEETVNYCGDIMSPCYSEKSLREIKENSLRVSVSVLNVEKVFKFENCPIIKEFGIDVSVQEEDKIIDGKCNEKAFQASYQRFFECKQKSEDKMRTMMMELHKAKADQAKKDDVVCQHFEHTLDVCFGEVKECTTSEENWQASRKAFITSAVKTNNVKKLGLNLDKCDFHVEE